MTAPHTPHDDRDLRQLTGAFDRPIAPSPHFADALKQRLNEEESTMQQVLARPSRPVSNRTARAMSVPPLTRRKWLDIAIAAVLIVGMLGGSFWYADVRIGGDGPTGPEATRYAAQPLSAISTPEPENETVQGNDPGDSANYPAGFDPVLEHDIVVLEDGPTAPQHAAIAGDILVVSGGFPEVIEMEGRGVTAIDLTTGEMLWTSDTVPFLDFITVDGMIYGAFELGMDKPTAAPTDYRMMALDAATGETVWTGEPLMEQSAGLDVVSPAVSMNVFRPTVIGGMMYYVDRDGQVIALDAATGEQQWSVALEHDSTEPSWGRGGSVVGNDDALYAVDGQNVIRKLDPATGEEIDRFPMRDRPSSAYVMDLHLKGDSLVAISHSLDFEGTTGFVDAVSTEDGEILWSQRLGTVFPFITMTDNVVAIPHRVSETEIGTVSGDITESGTYVSFFDLGTGDPFSLYGPSGAEGATVSSSGDVVCINEATLISCVDTASADRTLVSLPYAPGAGSFAPLLFWNETAVVLDMEDGVTLLRPTEAPQRTETPREPAAEARGGTFGTADRSLANPALEPIDGPLSLAWSQTISDPLWVLPYGDVVATLGSSEIAVHDALTGEVLWSMPTKEGFRNSTYDTDRDPMMTLAMRWRPIALPWIEGDTMYWTTTTELVGVDLHTGNETFRTLHTIPSEEFEDNTYPPADVVIREGVAYLITEPQSRTGPTLFVISAIDLDTGERLWEHVIGDPEADMLARTPRPVQLVATGSVVAMQLSGEENSILALDAANGAVLWERPNDLAGNDNIAYSNISGVGDHYLVHTDRNEPTGTIDGTPNADGSLGIAVYDLESGDELWTTSDNDFRRFGIEEATCGVATGWAGSVLYVACTADDQLSLIGIHIESGRVTYSGNVGTESPTYLVFQDSVQNLYYSGENTLTRLNPVSRQLDRIQLDGGDACVPNAASNEVVICLTDDGIGTYGIQVYARGPAATPKASPVATP